LPLGSIDTRRTESAVASLALFERARVVSLCLSPRARLPRRSRLVAVATLDKSHLTYSNSQILNALNFALNRCAALVSVFDGILIE